MIYKYLGVITPKGLNIIKKKTFKLFGFQIVWLRVYPMKVIPEIHRSH